jgi:hypothetical protein
VSEDEGFGDSQSSGFMSATPETPVAPPLNHSNIWEDALSNLDRPKPRYAWENVGVYVMLLAVLYYYTSGFWVSDIQLTFDSLMAIIFNHLTIKKQAMESVWLHYMRDSGL